MTEYVLYISSEHIPLATDMLSSLGRSGTSNLGISSFGMSGRSNFGEASTCSEGAALTASMEALGQWLFVIKKLLHINDSMHISRVGYASTDGALRE